MGDENVAAVADLWRGSMDALGWVGFGLGPRSSERGC